MENNAMLARAASRTILVVMLDLPRVSGRIFTLERPVRKRRVRGAKASAPSP
jgi:hypothetical protein